MFTLYHMCANVTYIPRDIGVKFGLSFDNYTFYSEEVSVRNPPPIFCADVPYLRELADICLRLHDVEITKTTLSGCLEIEAELCRVKLVHANIGCFRMPI
ncbi:hypothetical protein AAVH_20022 [Aphelenchoides avenae]|nr:hypothetical protein AAVH_20022 [Aphelenchus avenae]